MKLIDMHCDTIFEMFRNKNMNLNRNALCVDLEKLRDAGSVAQFFACFIYMKMFHDENRWDQGFLYALDMIDYAQKEIAQNSKRIILTKSYEEFLSNEALGKISAILTVEEGGILNGKIERLEELYRQGVRLITLTWNEKNCIGSPNSRNATIMNEGLTSFGREVVGRMNNLGMIIDVSHLSDGGFWEVMRNSRKPVVASHSNARALCVHPRNLTDEMIRALAENGGIAGVNFYPFFLNINGKAGIEDIVRHVEYMYFVGGEDFVAVGTDFDGFDDGELELKDIGEIELIFRALKRKGFTERQLEKMWNGNVRRVMKDDFL